MGTEKYENGTEKLCIEMNTKEVSVNRTEKFLIFLEHYGNRSEKSKVFVSLFVDDHEEERFYGNFTKLFQIF
jgi:hypothetical protein